MIIDRTINFPELGEVSSTQSYVLVGANGSGKSHLGAWIEQHNDNVCVFQHNELCLSLIR